MENETQTKEYTHREFLQQYILNRALGHAGGLNGDFAALEAEKAWKEINRITSYD